MNMLERETLRIMSQRGHPGERLVRGLIWAGFALFLLTLSVFLLFYLVFGPPPAIRTYQM